MRICRAARLCRAAPLQALQRQVRPRTVLRILIAMCESSHFVTPAIASLARHAEDSPLTRVPSPSWFTGRTSAVASGTMLERAGLMFGRSVEMMVKVGMISAPCC